MGASITLTPVPSAVTSGPPGTYTRGEELVIDWTVAATDGVATEPDALTFTVRSPDGVDTEYVMGSDPEIVNNADGTGTLTLILSDSSTWFFRCVTDTPTTAAEISVEVERSAFESPVIPVPGSPGAAYEGAIARAANGVYQPLLPEEDGSWLQGYASGSGFSWEQRRYAIIPDVDLTGDSSNATTNTTRLNAALATRSGCWVQVPEGSIVIDGPVNLTSNGSSLIGASETETMISFDGTESAWVVASGIIAPRVMNLRLQHLSTGAAPSSGIALQIANCFAPKIENIHITDAYNGVQFDSCAEIAIQGRLWLRSLLGVKGLEVIGNGGYAERIIADNPYQASPDGKQHRARVAGDPIVIGDTYTNNGLIFQCTANGTLSVGGGPTTVPGTTVANARTTDVTDGSATVRFIGRTIEWIYGGANVAGFTVQSCALLNGHRGFRQVGGNWWFFGHAELDHQWDSGVILSSGSGFRTTNNFWLSSCFTGHGVLVDTGHDGDVRMAGGKIFAAAGNGVLLQPGPTKCYFEGLNVGTCGGLAGLLAGVVAGAGPKHFAFRNNRVDDCTFGIAALGSDADYFHVTGNDCQGCGTPVDMSGATGVNVVVDHNIP